MVRSLRDVSLRFLRRADVGLGDDLHQPHAGAVQIHVGVVRVLVVEALAGVLLKMQALDANLEGVVLEIDDDDAFADDGVLVLRNLIALRQIGIEIVLPVEHRMMIDLRLEAEACADRLGHAFLVDHRKHARHRRVDKAHMAIRLTAESRRRAREELRVRKHLRVHFQADDHFPLAGCAVDEVLFSYLCH